MTDTNYKKALVTGATSGIGLETAIRLVESGIHVTAAGRRKEKLIELQNKISCDIIEIDVPNVAPRKSLYVLPQADLVKISPGIYFSKLSIIIFFYYINFKY